MPSTASSIPDWPYQASRLRIVAIVLYVISLALPVGHGGNSAWLNDSSLSGLICLLLGWVIPFIWVANPFVFIVWFLNSKNTKKSAKIALILSFLAALISTATVLMNKTLLNQIGPILWASSMIVTFIGSIQNFALISNNSTKSSLGMYR